MANVKTITLAAGAVTSVGFDASYPYYWVDNQTDGTVYAAIGKEPIPDADGTFTVAAGGKVRFSGGIKPEDIKLKGSGKVQIVASGIAECPFKGCMKGGEIASIKQDIKIIRDVVNGVTHSFVNDDTTAYSKPVPVGARLAGVKKIGGMTLKQNDSLIASPVTALHSTIDGRTVERTQIPNEIIALEGYGDGINDACCNYVDFEEKKYYKCIGAVDLGTLDWRLRNTNDKGVITYSANISDNMFKLGNSGDYANAIHNSSYYGDVSFVNTISIMYQLDATAMRFYCLDNIMYANSITYTDAASFKAAMSGVILYYELAEPIVTDISNLFTSDFNILDVIPGGQLTFKNENKIAVPSNVEYVVSLAEVLNDE